MKKRVCARTVYVRVGSFLLSVSSRKMFLTFLKGCSYREKCVFVFLCISSIWGGHIHFPYFGLACMRRKTFFLYIIVKTNPPPPPLPQTYLGGSCNHHLFRKANARRGKYRTQSLTARRKYWPAWEIKWLMTSRCGSSIHSLQHRLSAGAVDTAFSFSPILDVSDVTLLCHILTEKVCRG